MWKHLKYLSLSTLLTDYSNAYFRLSHHVLKIRIGLPVPHSNKLAIQVREQNTLRDIVTPSKHSCAIMVSGKPHVCRYLIWKPTSQRALVVSEGSALHLKAVYSNTDYAFTSSLQVVWRAIKLRTEKSSWVELCSAVDQHAQDMSAKAKLAYEQGV